MRISREDLYKEIWSEPATKLAQKYDVSSSYLARVCEGLNVPHPPRGYWARKAAGEKMPVPPLPPAGPGDPVEWVKGVAVMERTPPLALQPNLTVVMNEQVASSRTRVCARAGVALGGSIG